MVYRQPVLLLDRVLNGAPGWTEACIGAGSSNLIGGWGGFEASGAPGAPEPIPDQDEDRASCSQCRELIQLGGAAMMILPSLLVFVYRIRSLAHI